jgi:hypothetical protein
MNVCSLSAARTSKGLEERGMGGYAARDLDKDDAE